MTQLYDQLLLKKIIAIFFSLLMQLNGKIAITDDIINDIDFMAYNRYYKSPGLSIGKILRK